MLQRQIKKHHVAIMLLHWFNAFVWLFELITGLALITSPLFRVVPEWYVSIVEGVFGSRANMLQFHIALGVAWIVVFLVYGVFGVRTYLSQEVLQKEIALDRDDWRWLIVRTLRILGRSDEPLPPQGIYNAGQKLFAFVIYAMIPVVMLTGVVMAFRLFSPAIVGWAVVLHFAAVGVVVSGPDGPRVHGRGVPRGEAGLLLDDHRQRPRALRLQPPLQVVARGEARGTRVGRPARRRGSGGACRDGVGGPGGATDSLSRPGRSACPRA